MSGRDSESTLVPSNPRALIDELVGYVGVISGDQIAFSRLLQKIEAQLSQIERLTRERDQLLAAIGEHVTVRSDQYGEIQRLTRELERRLDRDELYQERLQLLSRLQAAAGGYQELGDSMLKALAGRDRLRAALNDAQKQLGALAVLILQSDHDETLEWARGVKVTFPNGEPTVSVESPSETPSAPASNTNACEVCGAPAVQWVLSDPFGKSDARRPLCIDHGMRLRDQEDVAEIERLRGRLDLIGRLSAHQPVVLAIQIAREALNGDGGAPETNCSDPGWEMSGGDLTCKGCGRKAREIFTAHDQEKASAAAVHLLSPKRCPDCGVQYVSGARHFSGCPFHPGELAQKASVCMGCNSTPCVCAELGSAQEAPACRSCGHVPAPGQQLTASGNCLVCEAL